MRRTNVKTEGRSNQRIRAGQFGSRLTPTDSGSGPLLFSLLKCDGLSFGRRRSEDTESPSDSCISSLLHTDAYIASPPPPPPPPLPPPPPRPCSPGRRSARRLPWIRRGSGRWRREGALVQTPDG
ncbi:hypothetical protein OJAV_G00059540 [Oryzias javanicus]|uniref:Uncharacterized protein n=1 Tax=Oryzias javanicus TaxID=123683 RepID=A0A437DBA1_ORYJA|nr:hypothetical protein OJAV_G00059540 [Oryzias javanicus]